MMEAVGKQSALMPRVISLCSYPALDKKDSIYLSQEGLNDLSTRYRTTHETAGAYVGFCFAYHGLDIVKS